MSAISDSEPSRRAGGRQFEGPRADDPRVVRSRAAVLEAARTLFLRNGYAGTTMEDVAALAGLTKRTLYNNYADKAALFEEIVEHVTAFAAEFARGLREELVTLPAAEELSRMLHDLGRRLALGIVRPEVIAIRRLLIGEARAFPTLATKYFDRAPAQVIEVLATGFGRMVEVELLDLTDPHRAAAQFAYLVAGEHLDHAMLVGRTPPEEDIIACAREGVETFLARYLGQACAHGRKSLAAERGPAHLP